jgi:GTP pyrophosphokinase
VRRKKPQGGVTVKGVDDILIRFGNCCQPLPGDAITGYITLGHGVTVHRTSCINALKMNPERQIDVEWHPEVQERYPVKIHIRSLDRVGLLADVTAIISKSGANILSANTETRENKVVYTFFSIDVNDTAHLNRILGEIKKVKQVQTARRIDD